MTLDCRDPTHSEEENSAVRSPWASGGVVPRPGTAASSWPTPASGEVRRMSETLSSCRQKRDEPPLPDPSLIRAGRSLLGMFTLETKTRNPRTRSSAVPEVQDTMTSGPDDAVPGGWSLSDPSPAGRGSPPAPPQRAAQRRVPTAPSAARPPAVCPLTHTGLRQDSRNFL